MKGRGVPVYLRRRAAFAYKGGIDSADGDEGLIAATEIENIFVGDDSCGDRAYLRQDHGPLDSGSLQVEGELARIGQLFVALIEVRAGSFLVVMNPLLPVFLPADVDVKIDNLHQFSPA
jgi:hypothetical protein